MSNKILNGMSDAEWDARLEALSLEPEAIALRQALDRALNAYWEYFARRGLMPGIKISVGENVIPYRKMH